MSSKDRSGIFTRVKQHWFWLSVVIVILSAVLTARGLARARAKRALAGTTCAAMRSTSKRGPHDQSCERDGSPWPRMHGTKAVGRESNEVQV